MVVEGSRLESPKPSDGLGADQYGAQIFIHRRGPDPTPIRYIHRSECKLVLHPDYDALFASELNTLRFDTVVKHFGLVATPFTFT